MPATRPRVYARLVTQERANKAGFDTRAIHAGYEPDAMTGAVNPPIYASSTYKQDGVGGLRGGYEYSRSANPTRTALEGALAAVEDGERGFAFASGLAAEDAVIRALTRPGDHAVIPDDAYGGTFRLFDKVAKVWGLDFSPAPVADVDAVAAAIVPGRTKLVWVETPTNPMLTIGDIEALATVAHDAGALLVVDNTFASPYLQQPLTLGADVVLHSTTKYVGGHSDVVGGAVVVRDLDLAEKIGFHQNAMGAVAGPFDAFLTHRGLKTLGVRMDRHCDNAEKIVEFLDGDPRVTEVIYPGLASHPGHQVAARQMKRFGGMISFRVAGGLDQALRVCDDATVFTLGESLGGVESLIEHPGKMTHASVAGTDLEVPDDLIRLSVGIETVRGPDRRPRPGPGVSVPQRDIRFSLGQRADLPRLRAHGRRSGGGLARRLPPPRAVLAPATARPAAHRVLGRRGRRRLARAFDRPTERSARDATFPRARPSTSWHCRPGRDRGGRDLGGGVSVVVCVDFGSTFTKAALVDLDSGDLLALASHPTTLPDVAGAGDVLDGYDACLARLVEQDVRAVGADVLACSSAGGGLRVAVVGNEELVTAEAGRRVALSSGGKVVLVLSGGLDDDKLADLRAAEPDVVLLVGGTDGGNAEVLEGDADVLAARRWTGPVVVAGNIESQADVAAPARRVRRRPTSWPTTWCPASACSRPTVPAGPFARSSSATSSAASTSAPAPTPAVGPSRTWSAAPPPTSS